MVRESETIPIFTVTNYDMVAYTATMMVSVIYNTKNKIDFYILDCGLSDLDKNNLLKLKDNFPNIHSIQFASVDMNRLEGLPGWYYNTLDTWAKPLFPELFPNVEKAIHIESDTIFVDDISQIYKEKLEKYTIAACPDITAGKLNKLFSSNNHKYFNLGVLLIDCNKWRKENITSRCLEMGKRYGKQLTCLDQDVLNLIFENNYKPLPNRYNLSERVNYCKNLHPDLSDEYFAEEWKHPVVIHFSPNKPWRTQMSFSTNRDAKYFHEWWFYASMTTYIEGLRNCFIANRIKDEITGLKLGVENYGNSFLDKLDDSSPLKDMIGEGAFLNRKNAAKKLTISYKFLNIIPILKIKKNQNNTSFYLLNFIPLFKLTTTKRITLKLFGFIPLLKIKRK